MIHLLDQVCRGHGAELFILHHPPEDVVVTFHPVDEQAVQFPFKDKPEIIDGIDAGRLADLLPVNGLRLDLVEEQLIGRLEVGAEPFIQYLDQR